MIAFLKSPGFTIRRLTAGREELEERFIRALRRFFREQGRRVGDAVAGYDVAFPAMVGQVFDFATEHDLLMAACLPRLSELAAYGATVAVDGAKQADDLFQDWLAAWNLPPEVVAGIGAQIQELMEQSYWVKITAVTEADVAHYIREGLEEGDSCYQIGARIREHFGGMAGNRRAQVIARTEAGGAINSGQQAHLDALEAEGEVTIKTWFTAGDHDVRDAHVGMEGVSVRGREQFNLEGFLTPYPGWWGLPAEHRVNCRCSIYTDVL